MDKIIMEYVPPFRVKLTYFRQSGKYYSEGEYISQKLQLYEIFEEVLQKLTSGVRPGLVDGHDYFYALVEVPEHPHNHPYLHVPTEKEGVL